MKYRSFLKNGRIVLLKVDPEEPSQHHIERGLFIASQSLEDQTSYEEAVKYSRIMINSKHLKCTYSKPITDKLQTKLNNT